MKKNNFIKAIAFALIAGVGTITFTPLGWAVPIMIISFVLCIICSWLVISENDSFTDDVWHFFLLGPLKLTAKVRNTLYFQALWISVTYFIGLFISIAWLVSA